MPRIGFGSRSRWILAALGLLVAMPTGRADEASALGRIAELNKNTGSDVVAGQIRVLADSGTESRSLLKEAMELVQSSKAPLTYSAAYTLAQTASQLKDAKAAEFFFRRCMSQAVALKSSGKLRQSYGGYIDFLYENKQFAESAKVCRELLELKTDDGKPRIVVFTVSTRFGEVDFIEDDRFDSAKGIRPLVHHLLIQAMSKQGKHDQAIKLVENLIKAKNHWLEYALKGWVLREAGQLPEAAKTYEDVLDRLGKDKTLDKEDREAYEDNYRYILSGIYVDLNQIDQASEKLQVLLDKNPDDPGYNNDLGYIWADHDIKLPEAEKLIRKALELDRKRRKNNPKITPEQMDRDNGAYLDSLGWVLFKQKKYKEAKDVLQKAVADQGSQHIEIYDHLGDVLLMLGEREAAQKAWQKALEVASDTRRDQQRKVVVEKKLQMGK